MKLSERLERIGRLVPAGSRLVDVGTDHAFLPIALIERGQITEAIASDVRTGPLGTAEEHIREHGLSDRIQTCLSDGIREIAPRRGDALVLAGMGGRLMIRILSENPEKSRLFSAWILQPQSEAAAVRRFVYESGFSIDAEDFVREDDKDYPMLRAYAKAAPMPSEAELAFGPCLLQEKNLLLLDHLKRTETLTKELLIRLPKSDQARILARRAELLSDLQSVREALRYYEQ